jgi:hypothetical protein
MWHNGLEVNAVKAFEDATAAHKKLDKSVLVYVDKGGDFLEPYLETLLESYCASMTLFDLAAEKIARLHSSGPISDTSISKRRTAISLRWHRVQLSKERQLFPSLQA